MAGQLKLAPLHGAAMTKQVLIIQPQSGHLSKKRIYSDYISLQYFKLLIVMKKFTLNRSCLHKA